MGTAGARVGDPDVETAIKRMTKRLANDHSLNSGHKVHGLLGGAAAAAVSGPAGAVMSGVSQL